jgi:hypothetical protein
MRRRFHNVRPTGIHSSGTSTRLGRMMPSTTGGVYRGNHWNSANRPTATAHVTSANTVFEVFGVGPTHRSRPTPSGSR